MFSFLSKDPTKKLKKEYSAILQQAMDAQRKGDIRSYSELTEKSEKIMAQLTVLDKQA